MGISMKRGISAWLLLLVYVPMMVIASLHIHAYESSAVGECEQCLHHIHHGGHLNAYSNSINDCVLCQFASLPYIASTAILFTTIAIASRIVYANSADSLHIGVCNVLSTRAPPIF